ncbi:hypothetical protein [Pseudoalteromonas sp. R3]|uniref:hypothetical protein n=1 Tax=Pseudoalteromonas sp. R3 TaxID=1709477 RepID=UPI0006B4E9C2|nr:hypothetical protein [Pseudoalteromonas sp. R3]AZZ95855.1 hypothetical protein ELR70_01210 [Pseudoalteromonas sp. R3]
MKLQTNALSRAIKFALASTATMGLAVTSVQAEEADAGADKKIEKIAVVGSRAAPRSVGDSPVPIDIIGGDDLSKAMF